MGGKSYSVLIAGWVRVITLLKLNSDTANSSMWLVENLEAAAQLSYASYLFAANLKAPHKISNLPC